jgi:hypothetical protein
MNEILVKIIEHPSRHKNTAREYSREIQEERFHYVLEQASRAISEGKVCYIFGMGKHPKSTYTSLKNTEGVTVEWYGSLLPMYLSPLRLVMASYEGIVKILDPGKLKDIFQRLSVMSMVGLYIFDANLESRFIEAVKTKKYSRYADEVVKQDSAYFIYQIDADSLESSTGMYEIVSYGTDCPKMLTEFLS